MRAFVAAVCLLSLCPPAAAADIHMSLKSRDAAELAPNVVINVLTNGAELAVPSLLQCGAGAVISGRDRAFRITTGADAAECLVRFGSGYTECPVIVVTPANGNFISKTCTVGSLLSQLDPTRLGIGVTLTVSDRRMTQSSAVELGNPTHFEGSRTNRAHTAGRWYFEVTLNEQSYQTRAIRVAIGSANAPWTLGRVGLAGAESVAFISDAYVSNVAVEYNGNTVSNGPSVSSYQFVGVAVDLDSKQVWFRNTAVPNVWNDGGGAIPGGSGGIAFTFNCPCYAIVAGRMSAPPKVATINFSDEVAFQAPTPAGYSKW